MKKKWWIVVLAVLLVIGIAGTLVYRNWYWGNHIQLGDVVYERTVTQLDLSGMEIPSDEQLLAFDQLQELDVRMHNLSVAEYEHLRQLLPECTILWKVPFQGQFLEEDTQKLQVTALTDSDLEVLKYFPELTTIDATGCYDYALLEKLKAERPDLQIVYTVQIAGVDHQTDVTELTIENPDAAELAAALPYLPLLHDVYLTGTLPEKEEIYELMCLREDIVFHWEFTLFGVQTSSTATELILNDIPMEGTDEIEGALKYFYNLQRVEMCNSGIPSEQMDALWKRHPDTRFVWTIHIGKAPVRTDVIGLIPIKLGYYMNNRLKDEDCRELKYLVDLVCLDMGHMSITDFSFLEYMPKLKYLILIDIPGTDFSPIVHCKELIYLELFFSNFNQTELLLELPKLKHLNIGFTRGHNWDVIRQMTYLERLWLPKTGLTNEEYRQLQKDMPDTQIVMHIEHSTAGGWRDNQDYRDMRDILGMDYHK